MINTFVAPNAHLAGQPLTDARRPPHRVACFRARARAPASAALVVAAVNQRSQRRQR